MKGMGGSDTSVKYRMPFRIMGCRHCDKPNLFDCYVIHGRITRECLEIAQEILEGLE